METENVNLYSEKDGCYTRIGDELHDEMAKVLSAALHKYKEMGCNVGDMIEITTDAVSAASRQLRTARVKK